MESDKKERWHYAQKKEDAFWQRNDVYENEMNRVISRYRPVIERLSEKLPANPVIIDVGCGPTCPARLFKSGLKIFLDPLMDSYKKTYGSTLPKGGMVTAAAEKIPLNDSRADLVFCVNALDHMIEPEKALSEIKRVLKKNTGVFVLGLFLHPPPIAVIRRFIDRYLPMFREDAHPYSYTVKSTRKMLADFFTITGEVCAYRNEKSIFPSLHREDRLFICANR